MRKVLVVVLTILFIGASVVSSVNLNNYSIKVTPQPTDTNGLVAYWNFNEGSGNTVHDNSGNGHNGTIYGASWTSGKIGNALYFDGDYDYVFQNPFNGFPTAQITVAFWMNTSDTTQEDGCAFSYACSEAANEFVITNYSNFRFAIHDQLVGNSGISTNDGFWHHIAVTWESSDGQFLFYKDGVQEFSGTVFTGGLMNPDGSLAIGGDQDNVGGGWESSQFFKGVIDEVRIYNRTLTQDEIQELITPPSYIWVDDDFNYSTPGWGYDHFSSIQEGIDAVAENGSVYVSNGMYNETFTMPWGVYVFITKNLQLIGENAHTTIINCPDTGLQGGQSGILVGHDSIVISNTLISGFTLSGGDDEGSIGIYSHRNSNNITIENCIIHNFADGMQFVNGSRDIIIRNCTTYNNSRRGGISFAWHDVSDFEISGCTSYSNAYGIHIAVAINGLIYHNNLYDNDINAYDESTNFWYNPDLLEGNYYDDYTGEDNNGDGIGDIPYNISGGSNQDLYPLVHPFELYYILNISLDTHEVDEGTTFNVTVKTLGGTIAPYAQVIFDDQIYSTGPEGMTVITAPSVAEDTLYPIVASKPGYTSDSDTILVKDVTQEFVRAIIIGKIMNLSSMGDYITFETVKIFVIKLSPFSINTYESGEQFMISKDYKGWVGTRFILSLCEIVI